jgi:hypothetical protein
MICLACPDYLPPSEGFITSVKDTWTHHQIAELGAYGVATEDIEAAFRFVKEQELLKMDFTTIFEEQDATINQLAQRCTTLRGRSLIRNVMDCTGRLGDSSGVLRKAMSTVFKSNSKTLSNQDNIPIFIVGNLHEQEPLFACRLLQRMLQFHMQRDLRICTDPEQIRVNRVDVPQYLLVVLTRGILESDGFPEKLRAAEGMDIVSILADTQFEFPTPSFYLRLIKGKLGLDSRVPPKQIFGDYKALFNKLTIGFSVGGNLNILRTEIEAVLSRLSVPPSKHQPPSIEDKDILAEHPDLKGKIEINTTSNFVVESGNDENDDGEDKYSF